MNEHLRVIITIVKVSVDLLYICGELTPHLLHALLSSITQLYFLIIVGIQQQHSHFVNLSHGAFTNTSTITMSLSNNNE